MALVAGSLAAGGWVWGLAGGGCESASDQGRGTKWSVAGEAVWRCGGGWALERNTAEPVRAEQWSGGDQTQRVGRRPHRPEPGRLKTTVDSGTTLMAEGLGTSLRRCLWRACPDTVCASGRYGRILGARKALWLWRRARTAAQRGPRTRRKRHKAWRNSAQV